MSETPAPYLRVLRSPDEDMTPVLDESVAFYRPIRELIRKSADYERRILLMERRQRQLVEGLRLLHWKAAPITGRDIDVLLERLES